jgi:4-amino-4-deoxy-L-arabinose transferase-like glycosyltransferase
MLKLTGLRPHPLLPALFVALALRVALVLQVESTTFDSEQYLTIARNLLNHGAFSAGEGAQLLPTMVRPPGYVVFLAGALAAAGQKLVLVRLLQAVIDTATVALVYRLASRLAMRKPVVAAWVAALCPFTAIFTTYLLAETLSIFFVVAALVLLVETARRPRISLAVACGAAFGVLILVRPEFGLLPPLAFLIWALARRSRRVFWRLSAAASITCVALFAPWMARNAVMFGDWNVASTAVMARAGADRLQPKGFWAWFRTWSDRIGDLHVTAWPYFGGDWGAVEVPERAIAAPDERREVEAILARLKESGRDAAAVMEVDGDFARLAKAHAASAPLRTWVLVPARRAVVLWVNGRTAGFPLPSSADVLEGRASPLAALVKLGIIGANFALLGLAAAGAWVLRRRRIALAVLLGLIAYRTIITAYYGGVEPRYVISAFPAIFLLASGALVKGAGVAKRMASRLRRAAPERS